MSWCRLACFIHIREIQTERSMFILTTATDARRRTARIFIVDSVYETEGYVIRIYFCYFSIEFGKVFQRKRKFLFFSFYSNCISDAKIHS